VVYKVDRLTRSLADFAKLVELFDAHGVSFVSVTQAFNTTTSMGRLTLNVLLSFAQFEREVTGERIRDKVAASKRKGMRMGGPVPLGYDVEDKKLVINAEEAEWVRTIFRRYLKLKSITKLLDDLHRRKILTKRTARSNGTFRGGIDFSKGSLSYLLKNRVYVGDIVHKGKHYSGEHPALLDLPLFEAVQSLMVHTGSRRRAAMSDAYLLTGKIPGADGFAASGRHGTGVCGVSSASGRPTLYREGHTFERLEGANAISARNTGRALRSLGIAFSSC
jgi:DNA invertase Pin-like site-specific DNA recombinase